jgi:hypothetical protein
MGDREALIAAFAGGAAVLSGAWQQVPDEARRHRPAPGEWSPHELVIHLADADVNGYIRFRKLVAEPGATVSGYEQDAWASSLDYHSQDPELAIEVMARLRALTLPVLTGLDEAVWEHTVTHSERGPWTMEDWLRTYTDHVSDHIEQMDAAVAAWRRTGPSE